MNAMLEQINAAGEAFVNFAGPMLVQVSVLILIILAVDLLLKKKVRAVFRYCLWMLVLVKLVLPVTLSSPFSLGYLIGDPLNADVNVREPAAELGFTLQGPLAVDRIDSAPIEAPAAVEAFGPASAEGAGQPLTAEAASPLKWEGVVFLFWAAIVVVMMLMLLQRAFFVFGLVAQAKKAGGTMEDILERCKEKMGMRGKVGLKLSANATSPAVCGLFRPVILVPQDLEARLDGSEMRAVLMHELAHIRRGDLWVNLAQTVLQIVYFYNPLLWVANAVIRRVREQAVDEAVLVAMGEGARQYPRTLVNVAKLAFGRPALSLRLIGVVESKSALKGRVKRILEQPLPKTAKLGIAGLIMVLLFGSILLPMAKFEPGTPDFIVKGTVTDADTGEPIAGAKVGDNKEYNDGKFCTVTDSSGNYEYKTWYEEHFTKCEAAGYKTERKILLTKIFGSEKEKVINFELTRVGDSRRAEFKASLANGVTVELVGVCEHPSKGKQWWRPDGSMLDEAPYEKINASISPMPGRKARQAAIKIEGFTGGIGFRYKIGGVENSSSSGSGDQKTYGIVFDQAKRKNETNISVGIAAGQWDTLMTQESGFGGVHSYREVVWHSPVEKEGKTVLHTAHTLIDNNIRVIAVDRSGKEHIGGSHSAIKEGLESVQTTFKLPLSKIKEFRFQTRPYEWVTFKNVSLKPNFKTKVQVGGERATAKHKSNTSDEVVYKQLEEIVELSELNTEMAFAEAIEEIKHSVDPPLRIVVMWRDLFENADIDQTTAINMDAMPAVRLGMALRLLLDSVSSEFADLGFVVRDGVIIISTKASLPTILETRVYDIAELVSKEIDAHHVAMLVVNTIAPESWQGGGGGGTISTYQDKKLVVSQTYEVHREIQKLLQGLQASPDMAVEGQIPSRQILTSSYVLTVPADLPQLEDIISDGKSKMITPEKLEEFLDIARNIPQARMISAPKLLTNDGEAGEIRTGNAEEFESVRLNIKNTVQPDGKTVRLELDCEYSVSIGQEVSSTSVSTTAAILSEHAAAVACNPPLDGQTVLLLVKPQILEKQFSKTGIVQTEKPAGGVDLEKLKQLGLIFHMYANDRDGKYPNSLEEVKSYDKDEILPWALENVRYVGRDRSILVNPQAVIAYDKAMLLKKGETNILFNDGHVAFCDEEKIKEEEIKNIEFLGIGMVSFENRMNSADRLSRLWGAMQIFANDHGDKYPENLNWLANDLIMIDEDLAWLKENIEYLGDKVKLVGPPDAILAYDKTLLEQENSQGTNVLYNYLQVSFEKTEKLKKLGIKTESQDGQVEGERPKVISVKPQISAKPSLADIIHQAAAEGKLACKLTTPDEFKAIAGQPTMEWTKDDGEVIWMEYPSIRAGFLGKSEKDKDTSFTLRWLSIKGKDIDIGGILQGERQVIVKNIQDFRKIELRNVDLRNLNLTNEGDYLKDQDFDSLTQWSGPEKLPDGFDPQKLLEEGKNPGLGIRKLHEQGIDGRGIGIAILDQKLLQNHVEYADRVVRYEERDLPHNQPLPMHGPPIVSIAVGKNCGVAPKAFVFYYAAMTTLEHKIQADCINEIIKYNETNPETGRIRVISISASPEEASDNEAYLRARKNALDAGIFIATCSSEFLDYGILTLIEGKDPDKPENYRVGRYGGPGCKLNIPTGNKTISTHQGTNVYQYERGGGHSWAAPYIAGLAALAFQVNPDVQPDTIVEQLVKTATHTKIGPVVNPSGFIEAIKNTW